MKNFLLAILLLAYAKMQAIDLNQQLIPLPVSVELGTDSFNLTNYAKISYSNACKSSAEYLETRLNASTGFHINTADGSGGNIQLNILEKPNRILTNEGYILEVKKSGIVISANKNEGIFNGIQTLMQLFPKEIESKKVIQQKWSIPTAIITDYPRFPWRGLMLDVSRHFFTKADLKAYMNEMAKYKFNTLHLHLTDDNGWRIEIKSLPRLTEVGAWRVERAGRFGQRKAPMPGEKTTYGGFYTQEDIRELVQYAEKLNITIVPEIDIPGHCMAALAAYPELCCTRDTSIKVDPGAVGYSEWYNNGTFKMNIDNTLNPANEKVYEFLDKVFTELAALFPSKYIHVGGDECYKGYWKQDSLCKDLMKKLKIRHIEDLQGYFMQRVEKILNAKGKTLLGWDEILEGGVSSTAAVMNWRNTEIGKEASLAGHTIIMSPTAYSYLDYCQGDPSIDPPVYANLKLKTCYSFEPVPEGANAANIRGGQGNLWSENIPTLRQAQYMIFPRAWALSEIYWSPKELKNWDSFIERIQLHFQRADMAEVNYSKAIYDAIIYTKTKNGKTFLYMETEAPGLNIYYTLNDAMPDRYTSKYTEPVALPEGNITLRVVTYKNDLPIGHLITLNREELLNRMK